MKGITESELSRLWQSRGLRNRELLTASGERLRVLYPGRRQGSGGPDFHHAVIRTAGGELRGDVELHVRSSGWHAHGHHRDPEYNGVVLHVVLWDDQGRDTVLQNGTAAPVLPLHHYLASTDAFPTMLAAAEEPCHDAAARLGEGVVGALLDEAGDERFRSKARRFRSELAAADRDQVLYQGLMRALGYSRNSHTFEELARRVPLATLRRMVQDAGSADPEPALHRALTSEARLLTWRVSGVRPANSPQRRIAAAAHLLARWLASGGLSQGLLQAVAETDAAAGRTGLEGRLMVSQDGGAALVGRGRAREMVVDILLPFAFAVGGMRTKLGRRALQVYRDYPSLGQNHITRQMAEQVNLDPRLVDSARRQQGLLHLYHNLCLERRCGNCPLTPA